MFNAEQAQRLVQRALRDPDKIPGYILRNLFPKRFSATKVENGIVTWNPDALQSGVHWGGGDSPPEISAFNYHIFRALCADLAGREYRNAVEIGCGYGRVTPWLSEFADNITGIDPNGDVLSLVETHYPGVNTVRATAQNLPVTTGGVGLVFTRGVLQHIPPDEIDEAIEEMKRIVQSSGSVLVYEDMLVDKHESTVDPGVSQQIHLRTETEYCEMFEPLVPVRSRSMQLPFGTSSGSSARNRILFEPTHD